MALAVGTALGVMLFSRTVHPPAGSNPVIIFLTQPDWQFGNYRSAIYYQTQQERELAEKIRVIYQANLKAGGIVTPITTEIAELKNYASAEEYHQDYLEKNPLGYCGLGGTGVAYLDPNMPTNSTSTHATLLTSKKASSDENWQQIKLNNEEQLISFEADDCSYCKQFHKEVLATWNHPVPIVTTNSTMPPAGWFMKQELFFARNRDGLSAGVAK